MPCSSREVQSCGSGEPSEPPPHAQPPRAARAAQSFRARGALQRESPSPPGPGPLPAVGPGQKTQPAGGPGRPHPPPRSGRRRRQEGARAHLQAAVHHADDEVELLVVQHRPVLLHVDVQLLGEATAGGAPLQGPQHSWEQLETGEHGAGGIRPCPGGKGGEARAQSPGGEGPRTVRPGLELAAVEATGACQQTPGAVQAGTSVAKNGEESRRGKPSGSDVPKTKSIPPASFPAGSVQPH